MQFRVVIPEGTRQNSTIRIRCPDGTEADVKIPGGLKPGDPFLFDISVDQLTNPQALLDTLKENSIASDSLSMKKGFLERDILVSSMRREILKQIVHPCIRLNESAAAIQYTNQEVTGYYAPDGLRAELHPTRRLTSDERKTIFHNAPNKQCGAQSLKQKKKLDELDVLQFLRGQSFEEALPAELDKLSPAEIKSVFVVRDSIVFMHDPPASYHPKVVGIKMPVDGNDRFLTLQGGGNKRDIKFMLAYKKDEHCFEEFTKPYILLEKRNGSRHVRTRVPVEALKSAHPGNN
ncbi:unnamed protein product [Cylindrotheca closterium]|uniref:Uncharacterized protein n=1 Tax=Cylindrotheca closterium TaxID=2856 RepID=A0AAD2CL61_9STRA|nr:unnamed protein product [Cylindrotheca closterium]